jgi:phosphatidylglycerol:prolipoprotein diacylglycerol transferase
LTTIASVGWPVLDRFRIGSFALSPHGLFIAIGFLVGAWLFGKLATKRGISIEAVNSIVFWSLIGAIVGARVAYVIAHTSDFASPLDWLKIWQGGISLLGGIAGATIANAFNIRRWHLRFFQVADAVAPCLALGVVVGRIGDLIIGDHLGRPTSWFLAWTYHGGTLAPPFVCTPDRCTAELQGGHIETITREGARLLDGAGQLIGKGVGVHQTALYDMILAAVLFGFLWWFIREDRREGIATLVFGVWYGCNRLLEDSLRIDKRFGPFTGSQWTALVVVLVSVGILTWFAWKKPPGPTTPSRRSVRVPDVGEDDEGIDGRLVQAESGGRPADDPVVPDVELGDVQP